MLFNKCRHIGFKKKVLNKNIYNYKKIKCSSNINKILMKILI